MTGRVVFVTGASRSGTSLTAGLIAAHGAWTGPTLRGDAHNQRGYFESLALKAELRDPRGDWPARLADHMAEHGHAGAAVFKAGPEAWPLLAHLHPLVVFCWRPVKAITASRARMGWSSSNAAVLHAWDGMRAIRLQAEHVHDVHADQLVRHPACIAPVLAWAGLTYQPAVAGEFVDPGLWTG